MRKILLSLCFALVATAMMAVPAKRGIYRTLRLADGTEVRAQLVGDEHLHFYRADDGTCYVANGDGTYSASDLKKQRANMERRRANLDRRMGQQLNKRMKAAMSRTQQKVLSNPGLSDGFYGKKKGLIILVQFSDRKFQSNHDLEFYKKLANQENYTEGNFRGSVHDFFTDQSNGQFDLTFDVVGPVTVSHGYAYYGQNDTDENSDTYGEDMYAGKMVAEACQAVKNQVDWSQYDWDGDGEADQVFCLYAGYGEADFDEGEGDDYIWPHMYYLSYSDYGKSLNMNGTVVDTYACSNELTPYDNDDGIGTICHEFSHCLGYPDLYDTSSEGTGYAMGYWWDLMDGGNYNGDAYCPAGYSGFEKWIAGWKTPIELTADTKIADWKPCSENGETYIIYNDGNRNEFYIIDNRQPTGWDAELPGKGMLVTHVDYNATAWQQNTLNNTKSHQRWSIIAADNSYGNGTTVAQLLKDAAGDAYPYKTNNKLTKTSTPKNSVFNRNTDGTYFMGKALTDITQNADGTMSFAFSIGDGGSTQPDTPTRPEGAVFYESFDKCSGDGGNDGKWSSVQTTPDIDGDNDGWSDAGGKAYGAYKCARFGVSKKAADVTSPSFTISGDAQLTFKAGAWKGNGGTLQVYYNNQLIATKAVADQQWTDITIPFTATGTGKLRFTGITRLFLDEVTVAPVTTGISTVTTPGRDNADSRIYTIDGRYAGTDKAALPKGIYIIGGKKFAK